MNGSGCNNGTSDLVLSWDRNNATFTVTMEFEVVGEQWFLSMAQLEFDLDDRNFEDPYGEFLRRDVFLRLASNLQVCCLVKLHLYSHRGGSQGVPNFCCGEQILQPDI